MISEEDRKEFSYYAAGQLECGTWVEIVQREPGNVLEMFVTPKEGLKIEDTARFKDGQLQVNLWPESLVGLYSLLSFALGQTKRKKFLGLF